MTLGTNITSTESLIGAYDNEREAFSTVLTPKDFVLIDQVLPASTAITHTPVLVRTLSTKTVYVSTTTNCTVKVRGGPTVDDMHDIKSGTNVETEDADRTWNCTNEKISFKIEEHFNYIQVIVTESSAANSTVKVSITGG